MGLSLISRRKKQMSGYAQSEDYKRRGGGVLGTAFAWAAGASAEGSASRPSCLLSFHSEMFGTT